MEASQEEKPDVINLIRQVESGVSQNILVARRRAEKNIADAHLQAEKLAADALLKGKQAGQTDAHHIIKESENKAAFILKKSREEADRISYISDETLEILVNKALDFICGKK